MYLYLRCSPVNSFCSQVLMDTNMDSVPINTIRRFETVYYVGQDMTKLVIHDLGHGFS